MDHIGLYFGIGKYPKGSSIILFKEIFGNPSPIERSLKLPDRNTKMTETIFLDVLGEKNEYGVCIASHLFIYNENNIVANPQSYFFGSLIGHNEFVESHKRYISPKWESTFQFETARFEKDKQNLEKILKRKKDDVGSFLMGKLYLVSLLTLEIYTNNTSMEQLSSIVGEKIIPKLMRKK